MKGTASMTMLADTVDAVIGVDTHTAVPCPSRARSGGPPEEI